MLIKAQRPEEELSISEELLNLAHSAWVETTRRIK